MRTSNNQSSSLAFIVFPCLSAVAVLLATACQGSTVKDVTAGTVGKVVELGKGTATGLVEGVEKGRKATESVDGAQVISSWDELDEVGAAEVHSIRAAAPGCEIVVAIVNDGDTPLRLTAIEVLAVDTDGFALRATSPGPDHQLTVPAGTKEKLILRFDQPADRIDALRLWGHDLGEMPRPERS